LYDTSHSNDRFRRLAVVEPGIHNTNKHHDLSSVQMLTESDEIWMGAGGIKILKKYAFLESTPSTGRVLFPRGHLNLISWTAYFGSVKRS